jgi:hypothetical protein
MEVQDIKFFLPVELVELIHHLVAHILTVLYCIASLRLTVMVRDIIDRLIRHPPPCEKVNFVGFCHIFRKVSRGACEPPYPLGIHRLPAEERYFK